MDPSPTYSIQTDIAKFTELKGETGRMITADFPNGGSLTLVNVDLTRRIDICLWTDKMDNFTFIYPYQEQFSLCKTMLNIYLSAKEAEKGI